MKTQYFSEDHFTKMEWSFFVSVQNPFGFTKSLRESSGKKQGAQEVHDGVHLSVISEPDHTRDHMHSDCTGCPHRAKCLSKACIKETRHEVDAVVTVDVTVTFHNV